MNSTSVIIIGTSHHNTYGMIKCFGEQGIKPILIIYGCKDSFVLYSNYIAKSFIVDAVDDVLELLINKSEIWDGSLVVSCTDAIASEIDLHYDSVKDSYRVFSCGESGKLTYSMNKLVQAKNAKDVGFAVPCSFEGRVDQLKECFVPFPRITKPVESIHGGKNIIISRNQEEFDKSISMFNETDKVIIQQFIQKEYEIVIVGLSIDNNIVIPGYVHKHRDQMGGTTYATIKPVTEISALVIDWCKKFVKILNYSGLFGIELIKRGDDYFFIEMNLRSDATTYAIAKAGVNLPMILYKHIVDGKDFNPCIGTIKEIHSMVEFPDFIHVLKREISILQWYKQLKNCNCRYFFSIEDKKPYKVYRKKFINFLIERIIKMPKYHYVGQ